MAVPASLATSGAFALSSRCFGWLCSFSSTLSRLLLFLGFIVISIYLSKAIYWALVRPFFVSPLRNLPGPKDNIFFLGQSYKFLGTPWLPNLFFEWSQTWPETPFIRYIGFANSEILIANNITAYRDMLRAKNRCFAKPDSTRFTVIGVLGDGLPFAEGEMHRRHKTLLIPPFSIARLKAVVPTLQAKAERLTDVMMNDRTATGDVEVESAIWKAALDVIGIFVLGVDLNHLECSKSPLYRLFTQTMQQPLAGHIFHYVSSYLPLRRLVPFGQNSDYVRSTAETRAFLRDMVTIRRKERPHDGRTWSQEPDALQCMINAEPKWSEDGIVEYLLNLMVLGHDTTACSMVWAVDALARHPQQQELLRSEIQALPYGHASLQYSEIERLPLLDGFVKEVLRLHCPVAYVPREATEDVEVAGVLLPRGTVVQLSPALINRHKGVWGEDADEFKPERWARLTGDAASGYAFATFHHGPRACLGRHLSTLEMKVMLLELVARLRVAPQGGQGVARPLEVACPTFTLRPKERLRVKLLAVGEAGCPS